MSSKTLQQLLDEFKSIVDTATLEGQVQRFLEQYPFLVSRLSNVTNDVVISQFPLGADYHADFAYISDNSSGFYLHLVEIERPTISIFIDKDEFSQPYNHALQQLYDWKHWCGNNQEYLRNTLSPLFNGRCPFLNVEGILIAGRRAETISTPKRQERYASRANQLDKGLRMTTYDGFIEMLERPYGVGVNSFSKIKCMGYKDRSFVEKK